MYKLNLRVVKFSLLLIVTYLSYFFGGYYEQSLYDCGVQLDGVGGLSLSSEKKFNVKIDIEMQHERIYFRVEEHGTVVWKGKVVFSSKRDFSGRVSSLIVRSIEDSFMIEDMSKKSTLEKLYRGREIPFSIQKVDDSVYYVKLSNKRFFCINKNNN